MVKGRQPLPNMFYDVTDIQQDGYTLIKQLPYYASCLILQLHHRAS